MELPEDKQNILDQFLNEEKEELEEFKQQTEMARQLSTKINGLIESMTGPRLSTLLEIYLKED